MLWLYNLLKPYIIMQFEQIIRGIIMNIVGRISETDKLKQCAESPRPEFVVVYGRRRVGKTYLVKEYFNGRFSFYATGVLRGKTRDQLRAFNAALMQYGCEEKSDPKDWFEAFGRLRSILSSDKVFRDPGSGKRIVFLDEVPWMDTARSDFRVALDYFWNSFASSVQDLMLIVCGSATSWIINNILSDKGGFYNRVTRQIYLAPFSLAECEELLKTNGITANRQQIVELYMVFGGIPYYLNLLDKRMSLFQNIDAMLFEPHGELHHEYDHLFESLFRNHNNHIRVIEALSKRNYGMLRTELVEHSGVSNGEGLTKTLSELEQCGFIRKYRNYTKKEQSLYYQIIDPFILFSLKTKKDKAIDRWSTFITTPAYYSWRGNAFEIVCLNHVPQIKGALGISGISSAEYSWRSSHADPQVQVDLIIDRKDDVINICEMKFSNDEFVINADYKKELNYKLDAFRSETGTKKALFLTMVTLNGLKANEYSGMIQNVIDGDKLFT